MEYHKIYFFWIFKFLIDTINIDISFVQGSVFIYTYNMK